MHEFNNILWRVIHKDVKNIGYRLRSSFMFDLLFFVLTISPDIYVT